ncbi:hypothetical protein A6U86_33190 [Rhizobium sp. AC27/96]|nr:hypothetical protein A6U86_33190 [Rhizobium sp. AC27/96]
MGSQPDEFNSESDVSIPGSLPRRMLETRIVPARDNLHPQRHRFPQLIILLGQPLDRLSVQFYVKFTLIAIFAITRKWSRIMKLLIGRYPHNRVSAKRQSG